MSLEFLVNLDYWQDLADDLNSGLIEIEDIRVVRCGPSNFYCHEMTCTVRIDTLSNVEWRSQEWGRLQELVDLAQSRITNEIRERLRDLKRVLYEAYESATSFEAYQALMDELDNRYTEDGTVIPHNLIEGATVIDGVQLQQDFDNIEIE